MVNQQNAVVRWGMITIVIIAGVWTLIHLIFNFANSTINDAWDVALLVLFVLALILAFVEYAHERSALVSAGSAERFPEPAISKFFLALEPCSRCCTRMSSTRLPPTLTACFWAMWRLLA